MWVAHSARALVLFVRHALPGETVRVRVTSGGQRAASSCADAIEVLDALARTV
jgi:tRNA/tmRNA/rRNA uracil-C5-methylase (TrmA/RlmC/RlmD family)